MKASYEHMADRVDVSKNYRNEDGAVAIGPRNIITNPPKVGEVGKQTSFGGNLPHMPDDFENARKLALKEYQEHKKKVQEKPFSQRVPSVKLFNSSKLVYGEDVQIPARPLSVKQPPSIVHDQAFKPPIKPPRSGYSCTLAKFPEYMENPAKPVTRKVKLEDEKEDQPPFKLTYRYKSRPQSSIVTNIRNIRASFPALFHR
jgi:hypothetical protein